MKIELHIHYPGLTPAEQARIGEVIRYAIQHDAVRVACTQLTDADQFILSRHLDVSTSLTLDPVAGPNDPTAVLTEPEQRHAVPVLGNRPSSGRCELE